MSTIATVSDSDAPAGSPTTTAAGSTDAPTPADAAGDVAAAGRRRQPRTLTIPLPTAVVGALVAGMFGLLFFSLNSLSADIDALRTEMNQRFADTNGQIDTLRTDMTGQIDTLRAETSQRFAEVHTILLDHTDRLARIETVLEIEPRVGTAHDGGASAQEEAPGSAAG